MLTTPPTHHASDEDALLLVPDGRRQDVILHQHLVGVRKDSRRLMSGQQADAGPRENEIWADVAKQLLRLPGACPGRASRSAQCTRPRRFHHALVPFMRMTRTELTRAARLPQRAFIALTAFFLTLPPFEPTSSPLRAQRFPLLFLFDLPPPSLPSSFLIPTPPSRSIRSRVEFAFISRARAQLRTHVR